MVQVTAAELPLFGVPVNCEVSELMLVFSAMLENVMEKAYCWAAPGSPVIAVPLFVLTELAVYEEGSTKPMPFVPVRAKVNLDELEVPVMVKVPPDFPTAAVTSSKLTNSVLPDWIMVRVLLSTPDAAKVAVVCLASRPVCAEADQETVSLPLPLVLFGLAQLAYAIILSF